MTRDDFWQLVQKSGSRSRNAAGEQTTVLQRLLETMPPEEIISFERHFVEVMHESYRADLWDVVYIVEGGCSDDGFAYFRYWLILQGKDTFDRVLARPESIADFDQSTSGLTNQEFGSVALRAYQQKTGRMEMPYDGPTGSGRLKGKLLSQKERQLRYPDLWKRFMSEEHQQGEPESASTYFRRLFTEHPEYLGSQTNAEVLGCFLQDHPGDNVSERIKQCMLNVKCELRSEKAKSWKG